MLKLFRLLVSVTLVVGLAACLSTEASETADGNDASKGEVKFCMQNAGGGNASILASSTGGKTPASVALQYSTADGSETVSKSIELVVFGDGYITNSVVSLDEGDYELTKFDVLDEDGNTIYSTPQANSNVAQEFVINTPLAYAFTVNEGAINTINMQVIGVEDDTDPKDFGHAAFTFDVVGYNRFYIDVLALIDYPDGWVYTTADLTIKDENGEIIKEVALSAEMNKIVLPVSSSYSLIVSKDGYASQEMVLSEADIEKYKAEPIVVELKSGETTPVEPNDPTFSGNFNGSDGTFDFTKLDANGNKLSDDATQWYGVLDNITGLMWEVKTDDGGLQDKYNRYTWYDSNTATNGGDAGENGSGAVDCTQEYVEAVNAENYLGHSDWRMPSIEELRSIVDYTRYEPAIDTDYFPRTMIDNYYWSATANASYSGLAWVIYFGNGDDDGYYKDYGRCVRLVRARQ